jgi:hypothetical protein
MKPISLLLALIALSCGQAAVAGAADAPLKITSGVAQLFIDDYLIESQTAIKRTLHQPKKDNDGNVPVLAFDKEYGDYRATLEANGTVIFDTRLKRYVLFGIGFSSHFPGPSSEKIRIYRFTSTDAMHWIKGDEGTPQRIAFDLTDKASGTSAKNTDLFSYYYDTKDPKHPYKGWLHFSNWSDGREGVYYVRSFDGIIWERVRQLTSSGSHEVEQDGHTFRGPGDVTTFYHDPVTDRFIGSLRFSAREGVGPDKKNRLRAKAFVWLDRMDEPVDMKRIRRLDLVPAGAAANGDLPHDEYYSATTWRYESLWLGGLKVWHGGGDYPWSAAGSAFLKLSVSRDGRAWKKVPFDNEAGQPEVFIANGAEGGNNGQNDGGYITEVTNAPLRIGDELIYYYGCSSFGKNHPNDKRVSGGGIFRARLRPDGFVSVDEGTLTTKRLECEGANLFVNSTGTVAVELLDGQGKSLGSATVSGDSLRHPIVFGGKSLRELAGSGGVRLRFTMKDKGRLYSFAVR